VVYPSLRVIFWPLAEIAHLKAVIEHISEAVYLPKTTLPAVKRSVGRILVAVADRKKPEQ
jgi:hypothetical protein